MASVMMAFMPDAMFLLWLWSLGNAFDRGLASQFCGQHVYLLDFGRLREKLFPARHQSGGHRPGKMGLAPGIVRESVENAKRGSVQPQRDPYCSVSLLISQSESALEKLFDLLFFLR